MRVRAVKLMVALALCLLSAPGLARAQGGTAQDRIQAAATALESVQAMRFVGQTTVTPSTGDAINTFKGTGEFQAPDRGHLVVEQPQDLQVTDTITVGPRSWLKTVDGSAYVPLSAAVAGPAPKSIADELREIASYMVSPSVNDGDTQTVITSDVDLARAIQDQSPVTSIMGVQAAGDTDQNIQVNSASVTVTLDRATGYPVGMNTSLNMVLTTAPEGFPTGPVTIETSLTLSDFNSSDIEVGIPTPGQAPEAPAGGD